jgi:hypothetical protein
MNADPEGYYARLGVDPDATAEAITAAFRRRARVVHPDVPGTGSADAFVALKMAYDVLCDPLRRAAYDRQGRSGRLPVQPAAAPAPTVSRSSSGLVASLWVGLLGATGVAAIALLLRISNAPERAPPSAAQPPAPVPARPPPATQQIRLAGDPTHYVTPGSGPAMLWLPDADPGRLRPAARIAPFTGLHALGLVAEHGLMAVALVGGGVAYVDAGRLTPGDAAAARRAFCTDQAGAPPGNAELLARRGTGGDARLVIHNRSEQPAVIKLRDPEGRTQASLFIAPRMNVTVVGLPAGPWRADVAVGELWSRACGLFAAGMRAQRLTHVVEPNAEIIVPPDSSAGVAEDIPDQAFIHD